MRITHEGANHICRFGYVNKSDTQTAIVRIISTNLKNIKTETVLRPLNRLSYTGINGGFFDADNGYWKPPTSGSSICYTKGLDGQMAEYEGVSRVKNFHENQYYNDGVYRKTMFIYNTSDGRVSAAYDYVKHIDELRGKFDVLYAIGGTDYNEASWGSSYYESVDRTVLAWSKPVVGEEITAYLIQVQNVTIPELKVVMGNRNLDPVYSVILDCGGSSGMQLWEDGIFRETSIQDRYLYNVVRLIQE
jgi:hypothetical protein